MFFKRNITDKVKKMAKQFPAIILTGARQTGKTTLLREIFKKYNYVSLDIPATAEMAETNTSEFLRKYPPPILIDEVQYAPKIFRHLKKIIDENRETNGQFILTGSQKFILMKEVSDSLAGRCSILNLENLSLQELACSNISKFNKVIIRGQYPELWKNPDINSIDYYNSYIQTYLERDVRQIVNVTHLRDFERFLRMCAFRNGQILNKSELARDTGISPITVNSWLSVLEASNQITLLEPFYVNFGKRIIKNPKLYFNDSGLVSYFMGIDEKGLFSSPIKGSLWETLIFSEIRKKLATVSSTLKIWYYRDQSQREVDFVLDNKGYLDFIEAKCKETVNKNDIQNIEFLIKNMLKKNTPFQPGRAQIISLNDDPYKMNKNFEVTNPYNIFLRI